MKINGFIEEATRIIEDVLNAINTFIGLPISGYLSAATFAVGTIVAVIFVGKLLWWALRRTRVASRRFDIWLTEWRAWSAETWTTVRLRFVNCRLRKAFKKRRALLRKLSGFSPH